MTINNYPYWASFDQLCEVHYHDPRLEESLQISFNKDLLGTTDQFCLLFASGD